MKSIRTLIFACIAFVSIASLASAACCGGKSDKGAKMEAKAAMKEAKGDCGGQMSEEKVEAKADCGDKMSEEKAAAESEIE